MLLKLKTCLKNWYNGEKVYEVNWGSIYDDPSQLIYKKSYWIKRHWSSTFVHKILPHLRLDLVTIVAISISISKCSGISS